ncbi:hypothetical protein AQUCO_01300858v1 [Aquilegia coerulea]|uniref:Myb/SANT-like domain-containing protein n=1 Tax=Aquilegia coerulea TaxID=218851 RepID=A0A2G5E3T9_AQUCA|nr:hypothetical protein AQUCO_01300858v1 [Aquilegia coerulea]
MQKDSKKFKTFRDRGLKWDYEKLSTVIGNSHATGSYSVNELDEDTEKNGEEESIDLEVGEETISTASTKKTKRHHGKRMRGVDEVKNMLEGVNEHLALLRETIDPLTFGKQLRQTIMRVKGFSHKYLNSAFKILMKNHVEAEIFLLTDEEGRVDVLNDLFVQNGDI